MPRLVVDKLYVIIWGQEGHHRYGHHTRGDAVVEGPFDNMEEAHAHLKRQMIGEDEDWIIDGDEAICDAGVLVDDEEGVTGYAVFRMCDTELPTLNAFKKTFNDKKAAMQAQYNEQQERAELERLKGKYE